nr:hypothetical protein GCM10020241_57600 [Streptoalloteichus tenebrarius]
MPWVLNQGLCSAGEGGVGGGLLIGRCFGVGQAGVVVDGGVRAEMTSAGNAGLVAAAEFGAEHLVAAAVAGYARVCSR